MSINVINTWPDNNSQGLYLDYSIFVEFDKEIEPSYLDIEYFMLYRTDEKGEKFFELVSSQITKDKKKVEIKPTAGFSSKEYYMVIILGGSGGIRSTEDELLDSNYTLMFRAGDTVSTTDQIDTSGSITPVTSFYREGDMRGDYFGPSTDLFSSRGEAAPITFSNSFPPNRSVGVDRFSRVALTYNDIIDSSVELPSNSLTGRWNNLPVDINPFADRSVEVISGEIHNRQVIFTVEEQSNITNKEFVFTMSPGVIRGTERGNYDNETVTVRFMGPLSPVYATPEQIHSRLTGWNVNAASLINSYELWKLILEVSIWVRDVYGTTMNEDNLIQVNRLTICLVLREILIRGQLFSGGIKSRTLLSVKVDYETQYWDHIKTSLDECIKESLPEEARTPSVVAGIKSGKSLMNMRGIKDKKLGVYR